MARPGSPAGEPGRNWLCRALPRARVQTTPGAKASDDEGVERGAGKGNGEQQSDSLFADHKHGWGFPVLLWVGARAIRGERGEGRESARAGASYIYLCAIFNRPLDKKYLCLAIHARESWGGSRRGHQFQGGGGGRVSFAACPAIRTMTGGRAKQGGSWPLLPVGRRAREPFSVTRAATDPCGSAGGESPAPVA